MGEIKLTNELKAIERDIEIFTDTLSDKKNIKSGFHQEKVEACLRRSKARLKAYNEKMEE